MSQCVRNKNATTRRRQTDIRQGGGKVHTSTSYTQTDQTCSESKTIDTIIIIPFDEDPNSTVLSLEALVDIFPEGFILFNFGKITLYLNLWTDFLTDIENTAIEKQKEFVQLHDVYARYKTFLTYRNRHGNIMILPKNLYFCRIFQRMQENNDRNNFASSVIVQLKDFLKPAFTRQSHPTEFIDHNRECCTHGISSGSILEICHQEEETRNLGKKYSNFQGKVSLTLSKKSIYNGSKRVILPLLQSFPLLPQLPAPIPLTKILLLLPLEEQLKYPLQVSEEQRDDDQTHSVQVVSNVSSTLYRDNFSFGFSPPSGVNNGIYSPVTSHAQSDVRSSERPIEQRPRVPPRHPNYFHYAERLMSYTGWSLGSPNPEVLSRAGFFFTRQGDLVRCFQCGIGLKDFSADDDPLLEHIRHSRKCPFLPELLGDNELAMYQNRLQAVDPEYNRRQQWAERQSGSAPRSSYHHPEFQTLQARLSSFTNWPQHMIQTPQQLAEAGLYYTGFEDQVRCFSCDGGLRRWDPDDDPWTEHCRWFPACPYALEQKGEQYIALVQASVENELYGANGGGVQDVTSAMEQLKLRESVIEAIMAQHRAVYLDMGYKEDDVKEAVHELLERGNEKPSLEDIIVLIDVIRERTLANGHSSKNETPLEENQRLKRIVFCMKCGKNTVNALFLPCAHHELCMTCAGPVDECPVCHRGVREKLRTYMA